jgi:protein-S-isoprenylcysteine O-methyltransferase Ste14
MYEDTIYGIVFVGITRALIDDIWYPCWDNDFTELTNPDRIRKVKYVRTGGSTNFRSAVLAMGQAYFMASRGYFHMAGFQITGVWLLLMGWIISRWARLELGKYSTNNVVVLRDHVLITTGPYTLMTNPEWMGDFMASVGIYWIFIDFYPVILLLTILEMSVYISKSKAEMKTMQQYVQGYYEYNTSRFTL